VGLVERLGLGTEDAIVRLTTRPDVATNRDG
jgi:hypothetical protein